MKLKYTSEWFGYEEDGNDKAYRNFELPDGRTGSLYLEKIDGWWKWKVVITGETVVYPPAWGETEKRKAMSKVAQKALDWAIGERLRA